MRDKPWFAPSPRRYSIRSLTVICGWSVFRSAGEALTLRNDPQARKGGPMLPLASFVLAALLGQASPALSEPPPCAAVNVPGCLPGYVARTDGWGRTVYVYDQNYVPPLAQAAPARVTPAHSQVVMPTPTHSQVVMPAPWERSTTAAALNPVRSEVASPSRGHVALVFTSGVSTFPTYTGFSQGKGEAQIALELRGSEGGGRLRIAGEYTSFGKVGELSVKYDLFDGFFFRPFLAVGLGIASINPDPSVRAAASGSAGLDLYLGRDFFLTGELKRRVFMAGTQGQAHGLVLDPGKQTSVVGGMGFYFF
jgi:hypothetical protein